ncbi:MAG: hypothetical protein EBR82_76335 [Caulobacteraceae bacterium]|nr:hypothetical protein [Caulobacteraceae bacterium]
MTVRLHQAQYRFHHSPARYRGFVGGRGAGKSWIGAYDLAKRALSPNGKGRLFLVAAPTYPMLSDSSLRTMIEILKLLGAYDLDSIKRQPPSITLPNGAEILFRSADDPERLRGPNLSGVWLDEASLMAEEAYSVAIATLRERGEPGWLSATFTPKGLGHWTYETFATGKPETELIRAKTRENPFLDTQFVSSLESQYSDRTKARNGRRNILAHIFGGKAIGLNSATELSQSIHPRAETAGRAIIPRSSAWAAPLTAPYSVTATW